MIGGENLGFSISKKSVCCRKDCEGEVKGDDGGALHRGNCANEIGCGVDGGKIFSGKELARREVDERRAFNCPCIKEIFHRLQLDLNGPHDSSNIAGLVKGKDDAKLAQLIQASLDTLGIGSNRIRHELAGDLEVHYSQQAEIGKVSREKEVGGWGDRCSDDEDHTHLLDCEDCVSLDNSTALMVVDTNVASPLSVLRDLNGHGNADWSYEEKILYVAHTLGITSEGGFRELRKFARQVVEREKSPIKQQVFK